MQLLNALTVLSLAIAGVSAGPSFNGTKRLSERSAAKVYTSCKVANTAALTFDDGPYVWLYDISKALIAAGAKGTFFFNGDNYGCIYDADNAKRVKYAYDKGHQIASHTWAHKDLSTLTWDQVHDEMWRVEQAFAKITGVVPAFMRPPYGNYNDNVKNVAGARGQSLVIWDFDDGDSLGESAANSKKDYDALVKKHPSNVLALNHEVYATTAQDVILYAIKVLQEAGYKLVTVAECLGLEPYQSIGTPTARDDTWTC